MLPESFWNQVDKTNSCWIWKGNTNKKGYGYFYVKTHRKLLRVHRLILIDLGIEIPTGMCSHHLCNNKACINPAHIVLLSYNAHGRLHPPTVHPGMPRGYYLTHQPTHCRKGHLLEGNRNKAGRCRTCLRRQWRLISRRKRGTPMERFRYLGSN